MILKDSKISKTSIRLCQSWRNIFSPCLQSHVVLKSGNLLHKWGLGDSDMKSTVIKLQSYKSKKECLYARISFKIWRVPREQLVSTPYLQAYFLKIWMKLTLQTHIWKIWNSYSFYNINGSSMIQRFFSQEHLSLLTSFELLSF